MADGQAPAETPRDREAALAPVRARIDAVIRRQRVADATRGLAQVALPVGLLSTAAAVACARLLETPMGWAWVGVAPVPLVILWAMARPRSWRVAARLLDRHYDLQDRLGNAVELARDPAPAPDPRAADIVGLVIDEAAEVARGLDPRPVVSLRPPGLRAVDLLAALAVIAAMLLPTPRPAAPLVIPGDLLPTPEEVEAAKKAAVDMALAEPLREDLRTLRKGDDAAAKLADAVLEVLDEFAKGELDREGAFSRLEEIEEELAAAEDEFEAGIEEDPALLEEGMRRLAEALEEHEITREAGEALARGDQEKFEEALQKALDKAAEDPAAQKALEKAMKDAEKALAKAAEQERQTGEQLAEAERRLKRQEKQPHADPEEQERRLKKQQKRVDELRRQHEREEAARRKLDELRRQSQQAGGKGDSQQKRRALEKLSRGASGASKQGKTSKRLSQGRDNLEEAKTFIRRSGKKGDQQSRRKQQMQRFAKAAKGDKGKKGKKGRNGPTLLVEGDVGDGDPDGYMEMPGQEGDPNGEGGDGGQDGQQQQGDGQQQGDPQSSSSAAAGDGIGDGSTDPLGDPEGRKVKGRDVRVDARQGRGATRAEVISTASQDGFASVGYSDVYEDYRGFAQNAMDRENLPPPQRRRIKRYFQMIQPRD